MIKQLTSKLQRRFLTNSLETLNNKLSNEYTTANLTDLGFINEIRIRRDCLERILNTKERT